MFDRRAATSHCSGARWPRRWSPVCAVLRLDHRSEPPPSPAVDHRRAVRAPAWPAPPISVRPTWTALNSPSACATRPVPTRCSSGRRQGTRRPLAARRGLGHRRGCPARRGRGLRRSRARLPRHAGTGVLRIAQQPEVPAAVAARSATSAASSDTPRTARRVPTTFPLDVPGQGLTPAALLTAYNANPLAGSRLYGQGPDHRLLRVQRIRPGRPRRLRRRCPGCHR